MTEEPHCEVKPHLRPRNLGKIYVVGGKYYPKEYYLAKVESASTMA
jgi:hypothetical protein